MSSVVTTTNTVGGKGSPHDRSALSLAAKMLKCRDVLNSVAFMMKQRLFRRRVFAAYQTCLRNEARGVADLREENWRLRQRLLQHAYAHVPYYRRVFDENGIGMSDLGDSGNWNRVPLLRKSDLIRYKQDLVADNARRSQLSISATGGSTGEPVVVYHDSRFPCEVLGWRMLGWWGLVPGTDAAFVWRRVRKPGLQELINRLAWWPTRRVFLDASSMTPEMIVRFVERFESLRPALLQGYVGAVGVVAEYLIASGIKPHRPRAVWVTSAPLSSVQRHVIEEAFGAPVYDQYGCGEVFWLAAECKMRAGLHVFSDARHLEIIDDAGMPCTPGVQGRVVISDLENLAFPLIRYETGDRTCYIDGPCACGSPFPLIEAVRGRVSDVVHLPSGRIISGEYLTTLFDAFPEAVKAFQIFQHLDASLAVRVVPNLAFAGLNGALEAVRNTLVAKTGDEVGVHIERVSRIASDRGKSRYVVSEYGNGAVVQQ